MQVAGTDAADPNRGHTHPEVRGDDAVNVDEPPADGGADAVNEHPPAADAGGDAVNERGRSSDAGGGGEDERLVVLLRDLVGDAGKMKTAESLGVSYRTLNRALDTGVLLPRMRDALTRRVLEEGGEAGLRHRARVEVLERRAEATEERLGTLERTQVHVEEATRASVAELAGRLEDWPATMDALAGRLARLEAQRVGEHRGAPAGSGTGESAPGGRGVVTAEPHAGEAQSYGAGMALVEEWRTLVRRRGDGSKADQARRRERVMELEIALIGEYSLALPPNTEPLHPSERERYLGWRRRELADLRAERRRRVALRWLRRALTLGLWWR